VPPPPTPRRISLLAFVRLFVPAEIVTIDTYPVDTAEGQLLRYGRTVAQAAGTIDLDSSEVAAFLALAQQLGVLTAARAARIYAGLLPETGS